MKPILEKYIPIETSDGKIVFVKNYNPNHDDLGRFSVGSSISKLGINVIAPSEYKGGQDTATYSVKDDKYFLFSKSETGSAFGDPNNDPPISEKSKKDNINNLSQTQKDAITSYTSQYGSDNYSSINKYLRTGEGSDKTKEAATILTSALNKSKLGVKTRVYRGVESDIFNDPEVIKAIKLADRMSKGVVVKTNTKSLDKLNSLIGKTITDKAPMSTSPYVSQFMTHREVKLVIDTSPTDKAIDVTSLSKYGGKSDTSLGFLGTVVPESEVLFAPNTSLMIKKVKVTSSGVHILTETINKISNDFYINTDVILNYNPNHDPSSGRFSSGPGTGVASGIKTRKEADELTKGTKYNKVILHGTSTKAADEISSGGFKIMEIKTGRQYGDGVYFTADMESAREYAKMADNANGKIISSKVMTKNPFIAKDKTIGRYGSNTFVEKVLETGVKKKLWSKSVADSGDIDAISAKTWYKGTYETVNELFKEHDAVIIPGFTGDLIIVKNPDSIIPFEVGGLK